MSDQAAPGAGTEAGFQRILLALDTMSDDLAALESAALLAARLEAELMGLFVEDTDLVNLAAHPETSAFSMVTASRHQLSAETMRRALRSQMEASRRAVERAATRRQVKSSFVVRQGRVAAEVLASAEESDLVIVGWACADTSLVPLGQRVRPGATACEVAGAAARSVLLLRPGAPIAGPVFVAYDGSPIADKAFTAAAGIAGADGGVVFVALLTDDETTAEAWRQQLGESLSQRRLDGHYLHMPGASLEGLGEAARRRQACVIVLGADLPLIAGEAPAGVLERADTSVLFVR